MQGKEKELESILKALANRRRLRMLNFLNKKGEASVSDIAEHINLSLKSTSRHLRVLFSVGVIDREQRNLEVFYSLSSPTHPFVRYIITTL